MNFPKKHHLFARLSTATKKKLTVIYLSCIMEWNIALAWSYTDNIKRENTNVIPRLQIVMKMLIEEKVVKPIITGKRVPVRSNTGGYN